MQTGPASEKSEEYSISPGDKGLEQAPVSRLFHHRLLALNGLGDEVFKEWLFHPGMLFGSDRKWWGYPGKRDVLHEGLDLCIYRDTEGNIHRLNKKTTVPVLFEGRVIEVCDDFLGKSVFIRHDSFNSNGNRLYTVYGHLRPHEHIHPGKSLNEGDIIGMLSNTGKDDGSIPHHLHISVAWIPDTMSSQEPGWKMMSDPTKVILIDPLRVIECPYAVLPDN